MLLFNETVDEPVDFSDSQLVGQLVETGRLQVGRFDDPGVTENPGHGIVPDHLAVGQHDRSGGVFQGQMHVVGDEYNRQARLVVEPAEKLHDIGVVTIILASRGLVQDQELGLHYQDRGDGYPFFWP